MKAGNVNIDDSWKQILAEEFEKDYFTKIKEDIVNDIKAGKIIYPPGNLIFNAFNSTPFDKVKVVIIGQDPYHGPGQAMGLCFSVPEGIAIPASLKRIYKEMHDDVGITIPNHGNLTKWTQQGVFMMNAILTVVHKTAGAHKNIGWQQFTDTVIKKISDNKEGVVFLLWGNFAKAKRSLIDETKHYILESAHPSPLAGNAFFGNHHFSKTNELLIKQGKEPIDWQV
ncbi:MAG TPA: uracil-DNA glycosylase [Bacteroidetes bacterium]|nr:uracil-DNA glycosylase [Bacteroidota bacterium]